MSTRSPAGRRGLSVTAQVILTSLLALASSLPTTACAPIGGPHDATWSRYREAWHAYEDCRMRERPPQPCNSERAAYKQALENYRAAAGAGLPPAPYPASDAPEAVR
jgi:hypothetical protein